jgi:hypothetical protein
VSVLPTLTWDAVVARRMARHALTEPADDLGPADIAAVLCGAHAQVISAAELSIGRRIRGATRADVRRALWEDRTLVKTFGPRGTVHLFATADLPMWIGAFSALPPVGGLHPEGVRFTTEDAERVLAAIGDALADAELTVDELTDAIADRAGPWAVERTMDAFQDKWPRWRQLTSVAAHRGLLCFGADRGRVVTYTNPRRWLPGLQPQSADHAVRALLARYLFAYGPARPEHFARFMGVSPRAARDVFESATNTLEEVVVDGEGAWVAAGDTDAPPEPHRGVRLLPYFDVYAVGGQPRERLFPGAAATRALSPTGGAGNYPVLLVDGVVGGVWHHRRSGRRLAVTVEPLLDLTAGQRRELHAEVELIGSVLDATPSLTIGPVTVGPHA